MKAANNAEEDKEESAPAAQFLLDMVCNLYHSKQAKYTDSQRYEKLRYDMLIAAIDGALPMHNSAMVSSSEGWIHFDFDMPCVTGHHLSICVTDACAFASPGLVQKDVACFVSCIELAKPTFSAHVPVPIEAQVGSVLLWCGSSFSGLGGSECLCVQIAQSAPHCGCPLPLTILLLHAVGADVGPKCP